jgi:hypothetical protein
MFSWFGRKEEEPQVFPDVRAAFDHACRHHDNRLLVEAVIPALVEERGKAGAEGEQYFRLRLAGPEGGREIWACTLKEADAFPEVGALVGFRVVRYDPDLASGLDLLGFIAYRFEPVFLRGKGWRIAESYTPANIKPTMRWL